MLERKCINKDYAIHWLTNGERFRLVRDEFNGHKLIWKYYESSKGFVISIIMMMNFSYNESFQVMFLLIRKICFN